jgi:hypothetical protein
MKSNVCPVRFGFMLLLLGLCAVALADTVYLDGGGILEGTIIDEDEDGIVLKCKYGEVPISRDQIDYIERGNHKEIYEARLKALKQDDQDGHYVLGAWAAGVGLEKESSERYEYILKLNPDHEGARSALGYYKVDERWVPEEEYYSARGCVKYHGRWMPKEDAEKLQAGYVMWRGDWVTGEQRRKIEQEERRLRAEQKKEQKKKEKQKEGFDTTRVSLFAVVIIGPRQEPFKGSFEFCKLLKESYNYPDEAIFYLTNTGKGGSDPSVDGKSTPGNVRKVFGYLSKVMREGDHLFIYLSCHGNTQSNDYIGALAGGRMFGGDYKEMLGWLPTDQVTFLTNTCHGGAIIPKLSAPGRVIYSSANERELHWSNTNWEVNIIDALKEGVSIKQAYNAVFERTRASGKQHPLLDDNGDGAGHCGIEEVVEGDGKVAAGRYLGPVKDKKAGPVKYDGEAIKKLREQELKANLALD